jgi:hypothetical protein
LNKKKKKKNNNFKEMIFSARRHQQGIEHGEGEEGRRK